MDDLLADFVTESLESLSELDLALVRLERSPEDQPTLSLIFRLVHTIKGTCGFLGLPRLEKAAHAAETVLDKLRNRALQVDSDGIGLILSAIDRIRMIVDTLSRGQGEPDGNDADLIAALEDFAAGRGVKPALVAEPAAAIAPSPASPAPPPPHPPSSANAVEPVSQPESPNRSQTIRVGVDMLENLMTLVSELVLTRNQLLQILRSGRGTQTGAGANAESSLATPMQRLSQLTSDLQEGVMKTRMQPIGTAWNTLPRLVRDLSHDLGKKIVLVTRGADTELDRQVLELIKDPLTHMIRNSADHGLEPAAERKRAGKPEAGTITLDARHEGGHVVIEISDDGRGLDPARIGARALSQGLVGEDKLRRMSEEEIRRFIFHAGFSTAAAVTSVSGRGVGMDVVKTNIERINGTIDLNSRVGRGSQFLIKIPLTLAIVSALIVGTAGERFAIPQICVVEIVLPGAQPDMVLETIDGAQVLRLRDRLLPLVSMSRILKLEMDRPEAERIVVVVSVGKQRLGLIVEHVFDTEEIVVKPVAPVIRQIPLFSGNTILGDGSVIMILDPLGIARESRISDGSDSESVRAHAASNEAAECCDLLLVHAGPGAQKALPLALIARLEMIPRARLEVTGARLVTQYRGGLMPLVALDPAIAGDSEIQAVLVISDNGQHIGLMVDRILDVVSATLNIVVASDRLGLLGTAIIDGKATEVVDAAHWLTQASEGWFKPTVAAKGRPRVLVVEDSDFFRNLLVPSLSAAGYDVTSAATAENALAMRDAGRRFDAIVSDIEMPGMNGHSFARKVREGGSWADLPMLALSSSDDVQAGRDAGFTDYIRKFERETLLASLEQCLAHPVTA
ncbi:chemotaxis protein CheW [Lichenicoccus sp.]|uniref:hybrid sensor histidine kinase/response regulator n=1 Tax=Lichenicoccus sp. TaxID=2781899 RepID=UPI003D0CB598